MATLGITEFFLFLVHKYNTNFKNDAEEIFIYVHFTLFYTAIFNAVMSIILAFFVSRNSDRLWVRTEYQDLHHYVELREEFDKLDRALYYPNESTEPENSTRSDNLRTDTEAEQEFEFNLVGFKRLFSQIYQTLQNPILFRKHQTLLTQIRFHEMRYHFIHANSLPITFKMSDYLKRCESHVLISLVEISIFAWLALMGAVTLSYFFMGVTVLVTHDQESVGIVMAIFYFVVLLLFVLIPMFLSNKMTRGFRHMMHMKLINKQHPSFQGAVNKRIATRESTSLKDLFWGGSPTFILICIQTMQFCYALCFAVLFISWEYIHFSLAKNVEPALLLLVGVMSYTFFVSIMAHVIPRFTLCSSLGELVDVRMLHETLAQYRLEEAKRKRQQQKDEDTLFDSTHWDFVNAEAPQNDVMASLPKPNSIVRFKRMYELVQISTKDLRCKLQNRSKITLQERADMFGRNDGEKSSSNDVSSTNTGIRTTDDFHVTDSATESRLSMRKLERKRSLSDSASIAMMRNGDPMERTVNESASPDAEALHGKIILNGKISTFGENGKKIDEDIPAARDAQQKLSMATTEHGTNWKDHARSFVHETHYKVISFLLGTLPCFFLVGMRLEQMLISSEVMTETAATFTIGLGATFWMETSFLTCFILVSSGIIYLYRPRQSTNHSHAGFIFFSAVFDVILSFLCLFLLMVAESKRCCPAATLDCCPRWGTRYYGGFGYIEPFTSLVAFRVFRFWVGRRIVVYVESRYSGELTNHENVEAPASDRDDHPQPNHFQEKNGNIVELWREAIGLYPEIVEKYGEFSGELLQTMLGVEVPAVREEKHPPEKENDPKTALSGTEQEPSQNHPDCTRLSTPARANLPQYNREPLGLQPPPGQRFEDYSRKAFAPLPRQPDDGLASQTDPSFGTNPSASGGSEMVAKLARNVAFHPKSATTQADGEGIRTLDDCYDVADATLNRRGENFGATGLSPGALSIIMAGNTPSSRNVGFMDPSACNNLASGAKAEGTWEDEHFLSQFVAPNSRLLRSMRRCDKTLLPMLDEWTPVDVVITKYEIVYFEIAEVDGMDDTENPNPFQKRMQDVRQALIATRGGQGLRLRDVAFGRKVVGRQELSLVDTVHVERVLPHECMATSEVIDPNASIADEFWKPLHSGASGNSQATTGSRDARWAQLKEDRLKIQTKHDTLYLRYYSDLDNMEHNVDRVLNESETEGAMYKNNAFLWCLTLTRVCGCEQLIQQIPHFGRNNSDELRDYLVVADVDWKDIIKSRGPLRAQLSFSKAVAGIMAARLGHVNKNDDELNGVSDATLPADCGKMSDSSVV